MDPQPSLATDARSLNELRRQAGADPKSAVRAAAGQFESIFMRQMLKAMREAVPKSGMWEGPGQSTYTDMFDQQLSQSLAGRPGGLGEVIARQLSRQIGAAAGSAPARAAGTPTAAESLPAPLEAMLPGAQSTVSERAGLPFAARSAAGAVKRDPMQMPPQAVVRQALAAFAATGGAIGEAGQMVSAGSGLQERARWVASASPAASSAGPVSSPAQPDVSRLNGAQADFVRKVWPHALLAEKTTGVPAAFIVGQAALESGWGRHEIRKADGAPSFNLFGVKAGTAWQGEAAAAKTTEYVEGQATRRLEKFRAYGSYGEAFQDWAGMMARSPRYSSVIQSGGSVQAFAANMQRAGYATDPAYGAKLEKTIHKTLALQRLVT